MENEGKMTGQPVALDFFSQNSYSNEPVRQIEYAVLYIEKGKGSAIFFHISSSPTAGCVGTSQEMVLEYLKVLDKDKNPYILTF